MNNLVNHPIKDHGYTREYMMKPEMQEKDKSQNYKILKIWFCCRESVVNPKHSDYLLYGDGEKHISK